uniref:O-phosphoseryl-tRNA(Sec) selenium transferase n=1 Tax=Angiostrongylus cantonensis TaxID=6313 RepID=A0A158P6F1_ANGCA
MRSSFKKKEAEYSTLVSKSNSKLLNSLWQKKCIPDYGWPDHALDLLLTWLASHDTNNRMDVATVGAGEREGRVSCSFVRKLHCNLSHGIGRSGNILDIQPKAIGSSMLACLANEFALHALQEIGMGTAVVVPMCTGMTLSLCMGSWRKLRPHAKYVLWLRVDQKSCLKSIFHAGFEPLIVEPIRAGDALVTDIETVNGILQDRADEILCVLSTTSCFSPRSPDSIEAISSICQLCHVPHLVNNAYGLQSEECVRLLNAGCAVGRIDAFVQSLDKNFQAAPFRFLLGYLSRVLHKASCVPSRDLVLTLLHHGRRGLLEIFYTRKRLAMKALLMSFASDIGESVYDVEDNLISLALTLSSIPLEKQSLFGSILFNRGISGARLLVSFLLFLVVVSTTKTTTIDGYHFVNFGSHTSEQHAGYLNIACGVGMHEAEVDEVFSRLRTVYAKFFRKNSLIARADCPNHDDIDEL